MERFDNEDRVFDLELTPEHAVEDGAMPQVYPMDEDALASAAPQEAAISGTALRHRLITPEALAEIKAEEPRQSLIQRLFRRK